MSWGSSRLARPTRAVLRVHSDEVVVNFEEAAQSLSSAFLEGKECRVMSSRVVSSRVESCRVMSSRVMSSRVESCVGLTVVVTLHVITRGGLSADEKREE